jgi:hypothetical protein
MGGLTMRWRSVAAVLVFAVLTSPLVPEAQLKVDIIMAFGTPASLAAKQATATIPIARPGLHAVPGAPNCSFVGLCRPTVTVSSRRASIRASRSAARELGSRLPPDPSGISSAVHTLPSAIVA